MFEPVFHYLVEAIGICAQVADLPVAVMTGWLAAGTALVAAALLVRIRVGR